MVPLEPTNFWLSIIIALLVVGEAIALLIGMNFVSGSSKNWLTLKNNLLLGIDILSGGSIVYLVLSQRNELFTISLFYITIAIIIITHLWRDIEYLIEYHDIFLANFGLLVVNNIKLIGAICSLLLAILPSTSS